MKSEHYEASVSPIVDALDPRLLRTMGAAIDLSLRLDPVANHTAIAVRASRSHGLDGALEAVERHRPAPLRNLECLVVVVAANIALCHGVFLSEFGPDSSTKRYRLGSVG